MALQIFLGSDTPSPVACPGQREQQEELGTLVVPHFGANKRYASAIALQPDIVGYHTICLPSATQA